MENPFANIDLSGLGTAFKAAAQQAADGAIADLSSLKLDAEQAGLVNRATARLFNAQLRLRFSLTDADKAEMEAQVRGAIAVLANINAVKQKDLQDAVTRNANKALAAVLGILTKLVTVV